MKKSPRIRLSMKLLWKFWGGYPKHPDGDDVKPFLEAFESSMKSSPLEKVIK